MKVSVNSILEKCIWLLTVFLFSSFLIFDSYTWGKYAFFLVSVLIVLLSAVIHDGIVRIRPDAYHAFFALFILYVAVTSLWAIKSSDAIGKAVTLAQILLCAAMLFIHYDRQDDVHSLIMAIMWSGYVVTIYAIAFYGMDNMLKSAQDIRLENEFANVNAIAMAAAISCAFQWNELMKKKSIWSSIMMVPAVILITATQSRKALILLLAGIFLVYILRTTKQQGAAKKILRLIFFAIVMVIALRLLFQLPIFAGSLERMNRMFNFWTDNGKADSSTILRNKMVELGIHYWKENPLLGVGVGSPYILANEYLNYNSYLHNNFVEMLCGGGLVGFLLYYVMYIYLFVCLFKYRKADTEAFSIGVIWLFLMLIMNYGMVTYYSKTQWYYLLVHFINVNNLRRKHREMVKNDQEPAPEGNPVPDKC